MPAERDSGGPSLRPAARRRALLAAGTTLAAAIAVLVALLAIYTASQGEVSVLIGTLGSDRLAGLAVITALASLTCGLCLIPVSGLSLILLIPARLAAIAATCIGGYAWLLGSGATVVPLVSAGCETGYVVEEESFLLAGWGTVYRTDGVLATAVARTAGDDGYHPFADGAYAVSDDGASLRVWYDGHFDYSAAPVSTDRRPDFELPALRDRSHVCGVSTGARAPSPTPSPVPEYDLDDVRIGVDEMVNASLAAAVSPIYDPVGSPFDPDDLAPTSTGCGDGGSRIEVALDFATADNSASLVRILRAWDAAGYSPDRAMQLDLRDSDSLPVARMSIRDSTTTDGLIHMQITSQCAESVRRR